MAAQSSILRHSVQQPQTANANKKAKETGRNNMVIKKRILKRN